MKKFLKFIRNESILIRSNIRMLQGHFHTVQRPFQPPGGPCHWVSSFTHHLLPHIPSPCLQLCEYCFPQPAAPSFTQPYFLPALHTPTNYLKCKQYIGTFKVQSRYTAANLRYSRANQFCWFPLIWEVWLL